MNKNGSKKGFSLAELLILLGVIGAIMILIIPNFNRFFHRKMAVTSLHKNVTMIQEACRLASQNNKVDTFEETDLFRNGADDTFPNKSVYNKYFEQFTYSAPFATEAGNIPHVAENRIYSGDNNASLCLSKCDKSFYITEEPIMSLDFPSTSIYYTGRSHDWYIDIDGYGSGPNRVGEDFFEIHINNDCSLDLFSTTTSASQCTTMYDPKLQADACFKRVVEDDWKIKYELK